MNFLNIKKLHCIGIGGIGVSAAARWAIAHGASVTGSDIHESDITRAMRREGVQVFIGHDAGNVPQNADMVVYTPAAGADNAERAAAKRKKIPAVSYPEFLGLLSQSKFTIAVTGTHGKSTTTALAGLMLRDAGFDPTVFVGSLVPQFDNANVRVGHSNFLVVEACEHQGNMRLIRPNIAIIGSMEMDHTDFYKDARHQAEVYQEFVDALPNDGLLVVNADDLQCALLRYEGKIIRVGRGSSADLYFSGYMPSDDGARFNLHGRRDAQSYTAEVKLGIPGEFNVQNALMACAAAGAVGAPDAVMSAATAAFGGIWRRFERVGKCRGAVVYSDYGHHPTAIRETLAMTRQLYPDTRVLLLYQPHQHNRTKKLFKEFTDALSVAPVDALFLHEIYDVAGREDARDDDVSSLQLLDEVRKTERFPVRYTATHDEAYNAILKEVREGDVVVVMGAGDIDDVARRLVAAA